jgi:hypothetical protein
VALHSTTKLLLSRVLKFLLRCHILRQGRPGDLYFNYSILFDRTKPVADNKETHVNSGVLITFCLQKMAGSWIWPMGHWLLFVVVLYIFEYQ